MYKAIVVDDEKHIRNGMTQFINSKQLGIEVTESFSDGKYALEFLKDHDVDIVITDIRMTHVSGLELAKYLFENKPQIRTIIISGYKEFEYAQQAIVYNVKNYILKPTNFKRFEQILIDVRKELEEERNLQESRQKYIELLPQLKEEFFSDIIIGGLTDKKEIARKIKLLGLASNLFDRPCLLASVSIGTNNDKRKWDYGKEGLQNFLSNLFMDENGIAEFYKITLRENTAKMCVISKIPTGRAQFREEAEKYFVLLKRQIEQMTGLECTFRTEYSFDSLREICGHNLFIQEGDVFGEKIKSLLSHMMSAQKEEAQGLMNSYLVMVQIKPPAAVREYAENIFRALFENMGENASGKLKEAALAGLTALTETDKIIEYSLRLIAQFTEVLSGDSADTREHIIAGAKKYIEENYNKDISLSDVAAKVFLNPAYLSRIFKKNLKENFSDYLIRIRMTHAVELLKQNYKVEDVTRMTGYNSTRYFSRTFKSYYGLSPREYARRMFN